MKKFKILTTFATLFSLVLLTSCSNISGGDAAVTGSALGVGGLTYKAFQDNSNAGLYAVGAAAGTYVLGKHIQGKWDNNMQKAHDTGYKKGLGDATRRQYEIIQNLQKPQAGTATPKKFRVYEFPAPLVEDGVNLEPGRTVKLRVEE